MKVAILLLAAGRGTRMGADVPKAYLRLCGESLLVHSTARLLAALDDGPRHDGQRHELLLLVDPADRRSHLAAVLDRLQAVVADRASLRIVDGGRTRQESMQRGLSAVADDAELVLVHDAARALVPVAPTRACVAAARDHGAALLAIPATDTLKRVRGDRVVETLDRSEVHYAQTPQIARIELYRRAAAHAQSTGFVATDDASLLEHAGIDVRVVCGTTGNLKITHPDDLPLAEALLGANPTPFPDRP